DDVQALVTTLGQNIGNSEATKVPLSTGVVLISKPSDLHVPPWQMVSALLGGVSLRAATFWSNPQIPATTDSTSPGCWDNSLGAPGPVDIAHEGNWKGTPLGLDGLGSGKGNHAKVGVSTSGEHPFSIFGDMNQQGTLSGNCESSQDGRGGLFFVVENDS